MRVFIFFMFLIFSDRFFRSFFSYFPDAVFMLSYVLSVFKPGLLTIILSFILGLYSDFMWCRIFGSNAFIYTLVSFLFVSMNKLFNFTSRINFSLWAGIASIFYFIIMFLISFLRNTGTGLTDLILIPLNFVFSFLIYDFVKWSFQD